MQFGDKLKMLRNGQKLTQQQLAERLGVAKSVVCYYESGARYPSYDVLVKIARIFHHHSRKYHFFYYNADCMTNT